MRHTRWRLVGVALMLVVGPVRAAEHDDPLVRIKAALAADKAGEALATCELQPVDSPRRELRVACGDAALRVGDRMRDIGQPELAQARWQQALAWNPALADDAGFLARLQGRTPALTPAVNETPGATAIPAPVETREPSEPREMLPSTGSGRRTKAAEQAARAAGRTVLRPDEPLRARPEPDETAETDERTPEEPPAPPGPRAGRHFSLGVGFGYADGLLGLSVGWLAWERLWLEVSTGLLYPTVDVRVRTLVLREALTPFIGVGLVVPFGSKDRAGLGLGGVEAIYELAEAFHMDLGLSWMAIPGLEVTAGVTFVTPFDTNHPDTVVFFPQLVGSVAWIF